MFNPNKFPTKSKNKLEKNSGELVNERAKDLSRNEIDGTTFYDESTDHWDQPIDESTGVSYAETNSGVGEDMAGVTQISSESINDTLDGLGTEHDPAADLLVAAGIDPTTGLPF